MIWVYGSASVVSDISLFSAGFFLSFFYCDVCAEADRMRKLLSLSSFCICTSFLCVLIEHLLSFFLTISKFHTDLFLSVQQTLELILWKYANVDKNEWELEGVGLLYVNNTTVSDSYRLLFGAMFFFFWGGQAANNCIRDIPLIFFFSFAWAS